MKKIVHVNQHVIKRNHKTGEDKPLSCGARVWVETEANVHCIDLLESDNPFEEEDPLNGV